MSDDRVEVISEILWNDDPALRNTTWKEYTTEYTDITAYHEEPHVRNIQRIRDIAKSIVDEMQPHSSLQQRIVAWARETFPGSAMPGVVAHLIEEVEELYNEVTSHAPHFLMTTSQRQDIASECADVMHLLFQIAEFSDFDLLEETERKFAINQQRTWGVADDNGVVHHIKYGHSDPSDAAPDDNPE